MRCTQDYGLPKAAWDYLNKNCKKFKIYKCSNCGCRVGPEEMKRVCYDSESGRSAGMFDDGPDLWKYQLIDETWVYEAVQEVVWSSGPCIFLCLEDDIGNVLFSWSDDEITNI